CGRRPSLLPCRSQSMNSIVHRIKCSLVAVLFAGVLTSPALIAGAPVPGQKETNKLYFPTHVGAKWVYQFDDGSERITTITKLDQVKEGAVITIGEIVADGNVVHHTTYLVSPDGVFLT